MAETINLNSIPTDQLYRELTEKRGVTLTDLSFVGTEELVSEIKRRCESSILMLGPKGSENYLLRTSGRIDQIVGLARMMNRRIGKVIDSCFQEGK